MIEEVSSKRAKGRTIFGLMAKLEYNANIGQNETLATMFQLKKAKDLKKGDRLILPSGVKDGDEEEIRVGEEDFLKSEGSSNGMVIFEVSSLPQIATIGPKGMSLRMTVLDFQTTEVKKVKEELGLDHEEEILVFVKEADYNKEMLALNEFIVLTKQDEKKKELASASTGKEHLSIFAELGKTVADRDGREYKESMTKIKNVRKSLPWMRKTIEDKVAVMKIYASCQTMKRFKILSFTAHGM